MSSSETRVHVLTMEGKGQGRLNVFRVVGRCSSSVVSQWSTVRINELWSRNEQL